MQKVAQRGDGCPIPENIHFDLAEDAPAHYRSIPTQTVLRFYGKDSITVLIPIKPYLLMVSSMSCLQNNPPPLPHRSPRTFSGEIWAPTNSVSCGMKTKGGCGLISLH